jgi:hypothetical protein
VKSRLGNSFPCTCQRRDAVPHVLKPRTANREIAGSRAYGYATADVQFDVQTNREFGHLAATGTTVFDNLVERDWSNACIQSEAMSDGVLKPFGAIHRDTGL